MYRIVLLLVAALLPIFALAQQPSPPKEAPKQAGKEVSKAYVPGLEQFMNVILIEHNKLWFAAEARNWPLAEYELGEIKEIMGDVQDFGADLQESSAGRHARCGYHQGNHRA